MKVLTIPGKPKAKERPRTVTKNGRTWTFTPKATLKYEQTVRDAWEAAELTVVTGLVAVNVDFWPDHTEVRIRPMDAEPPSTKGDIDNLTKSVLDALNGVAYEDDVQVAKLAARKH